KARYDLVDVGHFGLGMRGYAHFTSPIRRYADLANHRIVKRYLLDGAKPGGDPWAFADGWMSAGVASHIAPTETTADDAERADLERREIELGLRTRAARRPKHPGRAKTKARGGRQGKRR